MKNYQKILENGFWMLVAYIYNLFVYFENACLINK